MDSLGFIIDQHFACIEQNTKTVDHTVNVYILNTNAWYVSKPSDIQRKVDDDCKYLIFLFSPTFSQFYQQ